MQVIVVFFISGTFAAEVGFVVSGFFSSTVLKQRLPQLNARFSIPKYAYPLTSFDQLPTRGIA
jgi:hypothetical protein